MEDGVVVGQLHKLQLGEHLLHLRPDVGRHTVVVVRVQETAGDEVGAQVFGFRIGEGHIAVTGHVHEWIAEEIRTADLHGRGLRFERHA